jgi:hypothetical protein
MLRGESPAGTMQTCRILPPIADARVALLC